MSIVEHRLAKISSNLTGRLCAEHLTSPDRSSFDGSFVIWRSHPQLCIPASRIIVVQHVSSASSARTETTDGPLQFVIGAHPRRTGTPRPVDPGGSQPRSGSARGGRRIPGVVHPRAGGRCPPGPPDRSPTLGYRSHRLRTGGHAAFPGRIAEGIAQQAAESARRGNRLRLLELVPLFGLTPFDRDALLLCLAPELDLRYERLYAYLKTTSPRSDPAWTWCSICSRPVVRGQAGGPARFAQAPLSATASVAVRRPRAAHPPLLSKYSGSTSGSRLSAWFRRAGCSSDAVHPPLSPPQPGWRPAPAAELKRRWRLVRISPGRRAAGRSIPGALRRRASGAAEALCRELGRLCWSSDG